MSGPGASGARVVGGQMHITNYFRAGQTKKGCACNNAGKMVTDRSKSNVTDVEIKAGQVDNRQVLLHNFVGSIEAPVGDSLSTAKNKRYAIAKTEESSDKLRRTEKTLQKLRNTKTN